MNTDIKPYDALIVVTPADMKRLRALHGRIAEYLPVRKLYFSGSAEVGEILSKEKEKGIFSEEAALRVDFINEDDILPFEEVRAVVTDVIHEYLNPGEKAPRGLCGWYYQQFLKYSYAERCDDEFYLVWDGDTVPCGVFSMFSENGTPYLDYKQEYHEEYFNTMGKLIPGMRKIIKQSFISEHMLFDTGKVKELCGKIEENEAVPGKSYWEKILRCLTPEVLQGNSFSEFETYGTFMALTDPMRYRLREWHSFRTAGFFLDKENLRESDIEWLGRDFFALSFEKDHALRSDTRGFFDNPEYQKKLSARKMLEVVQGAFKSGSYRESWEGEGLTADEYPVFIMSSEDRKGEEIKLAEALIDRGENVITFHEGYGDYNSLEDFSARPLKAAVLMGTDAVFPGSVRIIRLDDVLADAEAAAEKIISETGLK